MRAVATWQDKVHDRDRVEQCIYDLCFRQNLFIRQNITDRKSSLYFELIDERTKLVEQGLAEEYSRD